MLVTLNAGSFSYELINPKGQIVSTNSDWEFPSLARNLGWDMKEVQRCGWCGNPYHIGEEPDCEEEDTTCGRADWCEHESTDGTVTCKNCGLTASDFIHAAVDWLDEHEGDEFDNESVDDYFPDSDETKGIYMTEAQREKCLSFFAKIHEDVTAHYHREIFADWLDEQGLWKESLGQRWLARNQREIVLKDDHSHTGWWRENASRYPKAGLPEIICGVYSRDFWEHSKVISPTDPVRAEFAFMERCTELDWDQDSGEPKEKK